MFAIPQPQDGGIIYAETNLDHFFPEPFNGVTATFFLFIAIYFTIVTRKNFKQNLFLTYCLGLIYIGGIGGTMYHCFRIWPMFRMMDWLPIMILCLSAGVYFLAGLMKWHWALLIAGLYIGFNLLLRQWVQGLNYFVNINYAMMALLVLLPVLIYLQKTKWQHGKWVGLALIAFIFALTFRIADKWDWLHIGTHFLWHILGAVASFCMLNYIYLTQRRGEATQA